MSARGSLLLASLALFGAEGCSKKGLVRASESMINVGTIGWPAYPRRAPPALAAPAPGREASLAPRDVVLVFPEIDPGHVLHWNATESFRVVVPKTPEALTSKLPRTRSVVGPLRTRDRLLTEEAYARLRCAFGRTWDGPKFEPKSFMVPAFCSGRDPGKARAASVDVVERALDDLRADAARAGAPFVTDIRCYVAVDPRRLWCEASAEGVSPQAG